MIATASYFKLQNFQIEKDYYVSLLLKELVEKEVPIVFKGGTSLSKCYQVIDRFSEDIDLALDFDNMKAGRGLRKRLKNAILESINNLEFNLNNPHQVQSDRDYNMYMVGYDKIFTAQSSMVDHIILETIVVYKPYPTNLHQVSNFITQYLIAQKEFKLIDEYNLNPFEMQIQTIERTFVDKLFALCDYHIIKKYYRYSRHLYDLHKIWKSGLLNLDIVNVILPEVIKDRNQMDIQNYSAKPGTKINNILQNIIDNKVYEKDFNEVTKEFLFSDSYYEELVESLQDIINKGILPQII